MAAVIRRPTEEAALAKVSAEERFQRALNLLTPRQVVQAILRAGGYRNADIARLYGVSNQSVNNCLERALSRLEGA